jgi:NIMA (never in mitosis gene a)-related kinase
MSIKDFEIICELGKGAFANVYKVKRIKDGEIYAMKKVCLNKLKPKEKDNALNEIRILASINHTNIISYKEAFYDNNQSSLCIIMEFADKGDLEKRISECIRKKIYLSENEIMTIFIQVVQGVKILHDNKILHRDVKTANIFLFADNVVKIGDLNVSKILKHGLVNNTQTGTPYYASPEVWNDKPYDYKSDIWSLGCLLYEMTTLKAPFRGTTMKAVYDKVMKGMYEPIPPFYTKSLAGLIKVMLQHNTILRPTCDQLILLLKEKSKHLTLPKELFTNDTLEVDKVYQLQTQEIPAKTVELIRTIKLPKKLLDINVMLPKERYKRRNK